MMISHLVIACKTNRTDSIQSIVSTFKHPSEINQVCPIEKCTALHVAVMNGNDSLVEYLLQNNADCTTHADDELGITPIHMAAMTGNLLILNKFIHKNPNCVNAVDRTNSPPIMNAVLYNQFAALELLLKNGADPNMKENKRSNTTLHITFTTDSTECHYDVANILLQYGCDVNAPDANGVTALHMAVKTGNEKLVGLFVNYGADMNMRDNRGLTPHDVARSTRQLNLAKSMKESFERVKSFGPMLDAKVAPLANKCAAQERTLQMLTTQNLSLLRQIQDLQLEVTRLKNASISNNNNNTSTLN